MEQKKKLSATDLSTKFQDSKTQLGDHLSYARTNNNLYQGNHFQKLGNKLSRTLDKSGIDEKTKIRVTKNHTKTICKYIINSILHMAPTGIIVPKNPSEIKDQKAAEIHKSVLEDYKQKTKIRKQIRTWAHDYVVSGEVVLHVFWNPTKGKKLGDQPIIDPVTGEQTGSTPIFEGEADCERIFPWDFRQDPDAKERAEAAWEGFEKMVSQDKIKKTYGDTEEIRKACQSDVDETYKIFEGTTGTYKDQKGMVLLRCMYFRPCFEYPNGYFVHFTKDVILAEGELPLDNNGRPFYPIFYLGFDEVPTTTRSCSIINDIRPDQMEINRCASGIALTQMAMGFDKLLLPAGSKAEEGASLAGLRAIYIPGGKEKADVIPGRDGGQFLATMQSTITEMYNKVGVPETFEEKINDTDIMASLYKNMRQKTRFSLYGEKFSEFLTEVFEEVLRLKKAYMLDDTFIQVVGRAEQVNIPEFRAADDLGYQIKVEQGTEDLESQFGRHMSLTSIMQYMGAKLDNNTLGQIIKNLPFGNKEEISSKFTIDYDNAKNIMLSLDRGEFPAVSQIENPQYIAQELNHRMRKPDFQFLPLAIQQAYQQQSQAYNQLYVDNLRQVQMAQQGLIPFDGPTVPVDGMYEVTEGSNGQPKQTRLQVPQSSLLWLSEKLKAQGAALGDITNAPLGMQSQVAQQFLAGSPTPAGTPSGQVDQPGEMNGDYPVL